MLRIYRAPSVTFSCIVVTTSITLLVAFHPCQESKTCFGLRLFVLQLFLEITANYQVILCCKLKVKILYLFYTLLVVVFPKNDFQEFECGDGIKMCHFCSIANNMSSAVTLA